MKNSELKKIKFVLVAQKDIVKDIEKRVNRLSNSIDKAKEHAANLEELNDLMSEIEENIDELNYDDIESWNDNLIDKIYSQIKIDSKKKSQLINWKKWKQFTRDTYIYCLKNHLDINLPWDYLLTKDELEQLKKEQIELDLKWDKWDYIFTGSAGILATLADFLLVKIPQTIKYQGIYLQTGSPITSFLKKHINTEETDNWFSCWAKILEQKCKVPYDTVKNGLEGATGRTHRLQSLGHDPVLGFIFGILDIYKGTITGFSYDHLSGKHSFVVKQICESQSINLIKAFLLQLGHLISDVGTKMGLPPPFFTLLQRINLNDPFSKKSRTIGQIARWMYLNGYDFRHFITMGLTPAVIEIILRSYLMLKHYYEKKEIQFRVASNPKYRLMLLLAHAIACAGNAGKIALYQGNPLAINYAEWLALFRYLLPTIKYSIFDRRKRIIKELNDNLELVWNDLLQSSTNMLTTLYKDSLQLISLGKD